jgi:ornithine cyclodeaminase
VTIAKDGSLLLLDGQSVAGALAGREAAVVDAVRSAYLTHASGASAVPHSVFLRFPDAPTNRIIALPAYLGGPRQLAGLKWIASFPGNIEEGLDRASALLILNSTDTGRPYAILEGSIISARRTAASAALAARHLWVRRERAHVAVIGCGLIAFEVLRFLQHTVRRLDRVVVYDLAADRAHAFAKRCGAAIEGATCTTATSLPKAIADADLVVFATTAGSPHVHDPAVFEPGTTILHVSLRDLAPELILAFDNVVDDVHHVCRAETSLHLAEQRAGHRGFIRATIAEVVSGVAAGRRSPSDIVVFSPFGLGVLDLAVAQLVVANAVERGTGVRLPSFLPPSWAQ